jgi:hypothetical protein
MNMLSQDSQCTIRNLNAVPPEYKSESMLQFEPSCSVPCPEGGPTLSEYWALEVGEEVSHVASTEQHVKLFYHTYLCLTVGGGSGI